MYVCPTPGTYTFPAETVTLTETTTVCGASTTTVPKGTHTLGGVTTVVATSTTIVCPYATTKTAADGVVTSVIETTTYVCPTPGTYTIAPITTTCEQEIQTVVVPVVETYCPGEYTRPAVTTTVTVPSYVVVCPYTSSTPAPPAPTNNLPPPPAPPSPPSPPSPPPPPPSQPLPAGGLAITYTPYRDDGTCKSREEVFSDLGLIKSKGFDTIKVYSTDCDTLPNVGGACKELGLSIILGVFVSGAGCTNGNPDIPTQVGAIKDWAEWSIVKLVVIGNEAIFNGHCSVGQLKGLIQHVRSELNSAGYYGPCTTTEVVSTWTDTPGASELCDVIDGPGGNIHPYFNGGKPADAGDFVLSQLGILDSICPGKKGYNLECGYPSQGNCIKDACPSPENQRIAISSILEKAKDRTVFFSALDDKWKPDVGGCGCEQSWGTLDNF